MKTWLLALASSILSLLFSVSGVAAEVLGDGSQLTITVANSSQSAELLGYPQPPPCNGCNNGDQYYTYDFGQVPINSTRSARFTLTSTGSQPLYLNYVRLFGQGFYGNTNCPRVLPPRCSCDAWVDFRPWYEGSYNGQLIFSTSAGNFIVNLYGWGTRW